MREFLAANAPGVMLDYIAIVDSLCLHPVQQIAGPTLIALAAKVGKTRLIDNVIINPNQ
jgi:pantoate--beta-alanine ligase